jgi:hypothetical protein
VTATRQDLCDPNDNGRGYAGFAPATDLQHFGVLGVLFAHVSGTFVVEEYSGSGAPPLTVELDLTWRGRGRITIARETVREERTTTVIVTTSRDALADGDFAIDGDAAEVTSASLQGETRTTFTR